MDTLINFISIMNDKVIACKKFKKTRLDRCISWLKEQNKNPNKIKVENDINFIVENNQLRSKFLSKDIDETIPEGVNEGEIKPVHVPLMKLRTHDLSLECEWPSCKIVMDDYSKFQKHVAKHITNLQITTKDDKIFYGCLWDTCNHKCEDYYEMVRHVNYHAYHAKLLAVGLNGRATLKLSQCKKDSKNRNVLPKLKTNHICMWVGCDRTFISMQLFIDHVRYHIDSEHLLCSWAGCGLEVNCLSHLISHLRSHTGERQIACYHCGMHFASNRKLIDHVDRQSVSESGLSCAVCGVRASTDSLLRAHSRSHVGTVACSYCDISLPTPHALAEHVRARHIPDIYTRLHPCHLCSYRSKRKADLKRHIESHKRKLKQKSDEESNEELMPPKRKKVKVAKKYCCHMCDDKIFSRGDKLTTHLIRVHGIQWPCGHTRFRYQISDDGMYRLTTTRYESLEVSQKIMERKKPEEPPDTERYDARIERIIEADESRPKQIVLSVTERNKEDKVNDPNLEITMCDVDDFGNIIKSEIVNLEDVVILNSQNE